MCHPPSCHNNYIHIRIIIKCDRLTSYCIQKFMWKTAKQILIVILSISLLSSFPGYEDTVPLPVSSKESCCSFTLNAITWPDIGIHRVKWGSGRKDSPGPRVVSEAWQDGTAESTLHLRWCPPWDEVCYACKVEPKQVQALCGSGQHVLVVMLVFRMEWWGTENPVFSLIPKHSSFISQIAQIKLQKSYHTNWREV